MDNPDQCRLRVGQGEKTQYGRVCALPMLVCRGCLESSLRIPAFVQDGNLQGVAGTMYSNVRCKDGDAEKDGSPSGLGRRGVGPLRR